MFILKSIYEYPDELNIISKSRGVLEETALSLYEEDAYEWFCVLNNEENTDVSFETIINEAFDRAFEMSLMYEIEIAKELEF